MGRGLSDLQQWILKRAASVNRLHQALIYFERFGWEPRSRTLLWSRGYSEAKAAGGATFRQFFVEHLNQANYRHDWVFSAERIGHKYDSTMASVSRSVRRLEQRGLVVRRYGRILIADAGLAWCWAHHRPEIDPAILDFDREEWEVAERSQAVQRVCQLLGKTPEAIGIG